MTLHFGSPNRIESVADAVPRYGDGEFKSKTRSTVPMLDLLIHSRDVFDAIIREIGFPATHDLSLEYTAGPFGGRGKASHTDVMLTAGEHALAVEAKWTEPMYETVQKWLGAGSENKRKVRDGWIVQLGQTYSAPFDSVIYQMLHRAASAAHAGTKAQLAYFLFESSDPRSATAHAITAELVRLWNLLGVKKFPFDVVEIGLQPLPAFEALPNAKGDDTDDAVRAALQGSAPLFTFGPVTIRRVGADAPLVTICRQPALVTTEGQA